MSISLKKIFISTVKLLVYIAGIVAILLVILYMTGPQSPLHNQDFNQDMWKSVTLDNTECIRFRMVYDLKKRHLKSGMKLEEVKQLLGEFDADKDLSDGCGEYYLGYCEPFPIDPMGMKMCFNAQNELMDIDVIEH